MSSKESERDSDRLLVYQGGMAGKDGPGFATQALHASKWSVLSEVFPRAVNSLVFLLLARLLTPKDFGVAAIATMIMALAQTLWDSGLAKSLVQRQGADVDLRRAATSVFWANLALAGLTYCVLWALAPSFARLFHDERVTGVVRVQGCQVVIGAFSAVPAALFQRALNFRSLFFVRLATTVLPVAISVPLALAGVGYWALVGGSLMGALAQAVGLWVLSTFRPTLAMDWRALAAHARFGALALFEGAMGWAYVWLDGFTVAKFLSVQVLGLYRLGSQTTSMAFTSVLEPVQTVLFSTLSRLQGEPARYRRAFLSSTRVASSLAIVVSILMFFCADLLENVVFGRKWMGVGQIVQTLAFPAAISGTVALNAASYRAMGRPDFNARLMLAALLIYSPIYFFTSRHSFTAFLLARAVVNLPFVIWHFYLHRRLCGVPILAHVWTCLPKLILFLVVTGLGLLVHHFLPWPRRLPIDMVLAATAIGWIVYSERSFIRGEILPKLRGGSAA